MRHILVPHPYGRPMPSSGAALRASKIALHRDVPVPQSAWMRESGLPAILSNPRGGSLCPHHYQQSNKNPLAGAFYWMAESEGFEPPDPFGSTVFKTAAFDHSASSPMIFTGLAMQP